MDDHTRAVPLGTVVAPAVTMTDIPAAGRTARTAAVVAAIALLLGLLWIVRSLVLVLFFAILMAIPISAGATFLRRRFRLPRGAGVAAIILLVIGSLVGAGALMASPIREQIQEVRSQLPRAVDRAEAWMNRTPFVEDVVLGAEEAPAGTDPATEKDAAADDAAERPKATEADPEAGEPAEPSMRERLAAQLHEHAGRLFPFVVSTVTAVSGLFLVLFLVIYLAADPHVYARGTLRLVPTRHRKRTLEIGEEVRGTLLQWLGAQAVSMAVIGVITTIALYVLDVKAALALGVLAGVSEFIPVFGPLLSAIPAIGIAFADSPTKALYVLITYIVIQQIESNIVSPLVMKHGVDVPPVVTILSGTIMTLLFGFLGLLIAVPLAAAALTILREITPPASEPVGDSG